MTEDIKKSEKSKRKLSIIDHNDKMASEKNGWVSKNQFYYNEHWKYLNFLVSENSDILDIGCGTGKDLSKLKTKSAVGIDISQKMLDVAKKDFPNLEFLQGDAEKSEIFKKLNRRFDFILMTDLVGELEDCQKTFENLHTVCNEKTRIIVSYYSKYWEQFIKFAEWLGLKMPQNEQNWLSINDIENILNLAGYEVITKDKRIITPINFFGLGRLINRFIGTLPILRTFCMRSYIVARRVVKKIKEDKSVSIVIPCKNEKGNIENAVKRIPKFGKELEIIYVEGGSKDGTFEEVNRVIKQYPELNIKGIQQKEKGKANAVREGFDISNGEILMILDADLTTPPEALQKFYDAIIEDHGEFINGSRLVYPLDQQAMRFLNYVANRLFSYIFTWLLNQRFTDTLCGTKVLSKSDYQRIVENRSYFGDFDPFGDFDLILGASKAHLKCVEIPVRYAARSYGETQISRFKHGWLLLKMVSFAYKKLKAM